MLVETSYFKKLHINVQGNKLISLAEDLCKMKKWNGGLVGNSGCDDILYPLNTFSAKGRRDNVDKKYQTCHDGNSYKNLVSDRCNPNVATDHSQATSYPTFIAKTPSQYNRTKESQSNLIQAQIGGGLGVATKAFIILVVLVVHNIILYALRGAYTCRKESKESIKMFNLDGSSMAPNIDYVE